jgi:hypothetical protein
MTEKKPTPGNTIVIGAGIGLAIMVYLTNLTGASSTGERIGISALVLVATIVSGIGMLTLMRKARK